jgi:hypothetical protein
LFFILRTSHRSADLGGDCDRLTGAQTVQEKLTSGLLEDAWLHIYKLAYDKLAYD